MLYKKGISPLIATILLVALVIAIALTVWFWYANFLQQEIEKTGKEVLAEGECVLDVAYKIDSASCFDKDNDTIDDDILLNIRNEGTVDIQDFRVRIYGNSGTEMIVIGERLPKTHSRQTSVEIPSVGAVQKLEIMPVIVTEGVPKTCTNKQVTVNPTGCS